MESRWISKAGANANFRAEVVDGARVVIKSDQWICDIQKLR